MLSIEIIDLISNNPCQVQLTKFSSSFHVHLQYFQMNFSVSPFIASLYFQESYVATRAASYCWCILSFVHICHYLGPP